MNRYLSSEQIAGRIVKHGQITDLTSDFYLGNESDNTAFSLFVRPKSVGDTSNSIIVKTKSYRMNDFQDSPIFLNAWSPFLTIGVKALSIDLTKYDVYWGSGI